MGKDLFLSERLLRRNHFHCAPHSHRTRECGIRYTNVFHMWCFPAYFSKAKHPAMKTHIHPTAPLHIFKSHSSCSASSIHVYRHKEPFIGSFNIFDNDSRLFVSILVLSDILSLCTHHISHPCIHLLMFCFSFSIRLKMCWKVSVKPTIRSSTLPIYYYFM